ncbi:MAG: arsenic transporter [Sphingomonas sp.]
MCLASMAGVLVRPWRLPEAVWSCVGAAILVAAGLVTAPVAFAAVLRGGDVYLFLTGMMLLSELARREGLFDWLAAHAVGWARQSPARLFAFVYAIGVAVTTFLSNDATAVVLTPAVYAVARKAETDPVPALFACALVANAASFVLPISNPANLVLYGGHMPPLADWLRAFALPSVAAISVTFLMLRLVERRRPGGTCRDKVEAMPLSAGGAISLGGIVATGIGLLVVSLFDCPLGLPTFLAGAATASILFARRPAAVGDTLRSVPWSVLPLVAGLFILVAGLERTGLIGTLAGTLHRGASPIVTAAISGTALAFVSNLVNNLPAGLVASSVIVQAHPPHLVTDALLIGVDLGPNLSITGSLATILWLTAIRREGEDMTFWRFLKVGAVTMPPALAAALAARLLL